MDTIFPRGVTTDSTPFLWNFRFDSKPLGLEAVASNESQYDWEIRYFWPGDHYPIVPLFEDCMLDCANYRFKLHEDLYLITDDQSLNLKIRKQKLLAKRHLLDHNQICAYSEKIKHTLPEGVPNTARDQFIAQKYGITEVIRECFLLKESMRISLKTHAQTKVEFSKIYYRDKIFLSYCIEGDDLSQIESLHKFLSFDVAPKTYSEFVMEI